MPAQLPSPVVGAGGQGSRPWFEQLLLTLASQGPQMLTQFLEHRQQGQQQQVIDEAAKGTLTAMSPTMSMGERAGVAAAGGQAGAPTVQGQTTPSGLKVPTIAPTAAAGTPNFSGMTPGVAPALLEMFTQQRTATAQQGAANASAEASRAGAKVALAGNEREEQLQPGRVRLQASQELTEAAQRDRLTLEGRLAENRDKREGEIQKYQIDALRASVSRDNAQVSQLEREGRVLAAGMAADHRKEYQQLYANMLSTMGTLVPKEQLAADAANIVFGVPAMPQPGELDTHYAEMLKAGGQSDLAGTIRQRVQQQFRVTPEEYNAVMSALSANGGDAAAALLANHRRGASIDDLRRAAWIYVVETGQPVKLPIEIFKPAESSLRPSRGAMQQAQQLFP